ncbi:MAG: hypothetical protein U1E78_08165 [Gammaproteobacteria bacterium]
MADAIPIIFSLVSSASSGLSKFLGVGSALLHIKQVYDSKIPWYQKVPAFAGHLLHATASALAGTLILVALLGATITFITPVLIIVSATSFIDNLLLSFRHIAEFFHYKKEIFRLASTLQMDRNILNSHNKGFFDFTKVTPAMIDWIKNDFQNKPENNELIIGLKKALPIYLEKRKEIEMYRTNISTLKKELSELQPSRLRRAFDRAKVSLGARKPEYMQFEPLALNTVIQSKTTALTQVANELMMRREFLNTNKDMIDNRVDIFRLQEDLRRSYELYQAFTDANHKRNFLTLKLPASMTVLVIAGTVCGLGIAALTAPVTAAVATALVGAALIAGGVSTLIGVVMFFKTRNREKNNKKEGEDIYLNTIVDTESIAIYRETPLFKHGSQYGRKDQEFQEKIAEKAKASLPVEMIPEQAKKQAQTWSDWIKAPFEGLRERYKPKTDKTSLEAYSPIGRSEQQPPASKMKLD